MVEDVERSLRIIDRVMTKWELKVYWAVKRGVVCNVSAKGGKD